MNDTFHIVAINSLGIVECLEIGQKQDRINSESLKEKRRRRRRGRNKNTFWSV